MILVRKSGSAWRVPCRQHAVHVGGGGGELPSVKIRRS